MVNIKANYKGGQNTITCSSCNKGEETQEHIYNFCDVINKEAPEKVPEKVGNIAEKLKVPKLFIQRLKIHERYFKEGKL